jgi:hypothetical protein
MGKMNAKGIALNRQLKQIARTQIRRRKRW